MNLIKNLPNAEEFNQIVYLGSGELQPEDLEHLTFDKLRLVEAHPELYLELLELFKDFSGKKNVEVDVLRDAVDITETTKEFKCVNLVEMSGFDLPIGLNQLYPGLKVLETESIKTTALVDLFSSFDLQNKQTKNLLLIDIPTQIDSLLSEFLESEYAIFFSDIQFTKSTFPLSDEDISLKEWLARLTEKGFELQSQSNDQDDFIVYRVNKNRLFDELTTLHITHANSVKEHGQEVSNLNSQLESLDVQLKEEVQEKENLIRALEKEVSSLNTEKELHSNTRESEIKYKDWVNNLKNKLEQLETEYQNFVQESAHEQDELNEQLKEKMAMLTELTAQKMEIEGCLNAVTEENKTLLLKLEEACNQLEEKIKWLTDHEKWNAGLKNENASLVEKVTGFEMQIENLTKQLETKNKESTTKNQKLQEQQYRNERLEQEVIKLEAQLELIKDVILREKAF
jgi:predicted nuclease with TOPRIM domain